MQQMNFTIPISTNIGVRNSRSGSNSGGDGVNGEDEDEGDDDDDNDDQQENEDKDEDEDENDGWFIWKQCSMISYHLSCGLKHINVVELL